MNTLPITRWSVLYSICIIAGMTLAATSFLLMLVWLDAVPPAATNMRHQWLALAGSLVTFFVTLLVLYVPVFIHIKPVESGAMQDASTELPAVVVPPHEQLPPGFCSEVPNSPRLERRKKSSLIITGDNP